MTEATHMAREIDEIPEAAARLFEAAAQASLRDAAGRLRRRDPPFLMTVARGSSDHAATYLAYAVECLLGVPVASVRPSVRSVYGRDLRSAGAAAFAISQSGGSADLVAMSESLGSGGAEVIALTNVEGSPLEKVATLRIATLAGPERAVAATKSFSNSIVAGLWIAAYWAGDAALLDALQRLPGRLGALRDVELPAVAEALHDARSAVVVARGPALGVAAEIALKLQETSGLFAAPYSAAEVLHGPSAMLTPDIPVLALTSGRGLGMDQSLQALDRIGARVVPISTECPPLHPLLDPLLDLVPVYRALERLARARGFDPDRPPNLRKETVTI